MECENREKIEWISLACETTESLTTKLAPEISPR